MKLVYFFGSKAAGNDGPLSDYDFAFYINESDLKKISDLRLELIGAVSDILHSDNFNVVILNTASSPEFKYNIIKEGKLIYEQEPFKIIVEPRILNEYFDFYMMLKRHGLTRA